MKVRRAGALAALAIAVGCSSGGGSAGAGGGGAGSGGVTAGSGGARAGQGGSVAGGPAGATAGASGGAGAAGGAPMGGSSLAGSAGQGAAGMVPDAGAAKDSAMAMQILPSLRDGNYAFAHEDVTFEVDPRVGGRVTAFSLAGTNLLTGSSVEKDNWGSTFWPSPQSAWGWPPPAEIDHASYGAMVDGDTLVLAGMPSPRAANLSATKRFRFDAETGAVRIDYAFKNQGTATTKVAPWEITRVHPGNLTFFALGPGGVHPQGPSFDPVAVETREGIVWFAFDATKIARSQKLFVDGKGWLAHVDRARRLLFVKAWTDVPDAARAPAEAEIEIFVDGEKRYVELEQQGAHADLAANAEARWAVRWYLRRIPAATSLDVGSAGLVDLVTALVR